MGVQKKYYNPGIIDLFSGVGGLSLGAARAGFSVGCSVELDPHAIAAHRLNFTNTTHLHEDVSKLTGQGLRANLGMLNGELAGIVGGPPCQGFSAIGKNDIADPRNNLFSEFFRIVAEARPKFFMAENVPGILGDRYSAIRERALSAVDKHYTLLPPIRVCAKDYGAPTTRTRVLFIGYDKNEMNPLTEEDFAPPADALPITVRDALKGLPIKINPNWQSEAEGWRIARVYGEGFFEDRLHGYIPTGVGNARALERLKKESKASGSLGTIHSDEVAKRYANIEHGKSDPISKSHRLCPSGFCPTLRAGTGSDKGSYQAVRPLHPIEARVITPREAARLQGFPDWFQFAPSKWHSFRQIGNSVSPILAERVLQVIHDALDEK